MKTEKCLTKTNDSKKMDYNSKTIPELKEICKQRKIKGISRKSKMYIVELLKSSESTKPDNESEPVLGNDIPELKEVIVPRLNDKKKFRDDSYERKKIEKF